MNHENKNLGREVRTVGHLTAALLHEARTSAAAQYLKEHSARHLARTDIEHRGLTLEFSRGAGTITLYVGGAFGGGTEIGINWSSPGSQDVATARDFFVLGELVVLLASACQRVVARHEDGATV